MSGLIGHYRDMARNNAYSNAHLLAACCKLSDEAFAVRREFFLLNDGPLCDADEKAFNARA